MSFRISALPMSLFSSFMEMTDEQLREWGAIRRIADRNPGFPCRVSLRDAQIGETVLLLNYEHQAAHTPFRSSHAVYVRANAQEARCAIDEVPELLRVRLISARGFDRQGMLLDADVTQGVELEILIERLLSNPHIDYIHLHYAKPGCYAARVDRA